MKFTRLEVFFFFTNNIVRESNLRPECKIELSNQLETSCIEHTLHRGAIHIIISTQFTKLDNRIVTRCHFSGKNKRKKEFKNPN